MTTSADPSLGPLAQMVQAFVDADGNDETTTRILDAAYEEFSLVGIGRASMEDVARRAGVSRQTVYRHVSNKDSLVERVMRREFQRHAQRYVADLECADSAVDRVVGGYVSTIHAIRNDPLLTSILTGELDALVSSMAESAEHVLSMARTFLTMILQLERAAGEIADDVDLDVVADLMVRVAVSYVLIPSEVVDLDDGDRTDAMARTFLLPLLGWADR